MTNLNNSYFHIVIKLYQIPANCHFLIEDELHFRAKWYFQQIYDNKKLSVCLICTDYKNSLLYHGNYFYNSGLVFVNLECNSNCKICVKTRSRVIESMRFISVMSYRHSDRKFSLTYHLKKSKAIAKREIMKKRTRFTEN